MLTPRCGVSATVESLNTEFAEPLRPVIRQPTDAGLRGLRVKA